VTVIKFIWPRFWTGQVGFIKYFYCSFIVLFTFSGCTEKPSEYNFPPVDDLPVNIGLQDPFMKDDRSRITSLDEWPGQREYLKKMLTYYMYGETPPIPEQILIEPITSRTLYNDSIIEETFFILIERNDKQTKFKTGIRRPNRNGNFPVIIKNDSFIFDLSEVVNEGTRSRYKELKRDEIEEYVAKEACRRGYVICKFNRDEVAADNKDSRSTGVFTLYDDYIWGTITAWAWAYSIIIDYLEKQSYVDPEKIAATGHSRGGKTALCAGVYEDRIAITAPSSSGAGGTASWRHFDPDQDQQRIILHREKFPYWWKSIMYDFSGNEDKMPFDAHFQKALIAPRGLINTHSRDDYHANPYGTYLTYLAADIVYDWLGANGNQGIHWRNGPHNQNEEDWFALFEFCDQYFFGKKSEVEFTQNPHPGKYQFEDDIFFKTPQN
jgi:hypothetical protein